MKFIQLVIFSILINCILITKVYSFQNFIQKIIQNIDLQQQQQSSDSDNISLEYLQIQSSKFNAVIHGYLGIKPPHQLAINVNWSATSITGKGQFSGNLENLKFKIIINKPFTVNFTGTIKDVLATPSLKVKFRWEKLFFPFNNPFIFSNKGSGNFAISETKQITANLFTNELLFRNTKLKSLNLKLQPNDLFINLRLSAQESISAYLQGKLQNNSWLGKLKQLRIITKKLGDWQLQQATNLKLSMKEIQIARNCLQDFQKARLCFQFNWKQHQDSKLNLRIDHVPLNMINRFLPYTDITGKVNGKLIANLTSNGNLKSDMRLKISSGYIKTQISEDEYKEFPHRGGTLNLKVDQQGLNSQFTFRLLKRSGLQLNIKLPNFNKLPLNEIQPIQGRIKANLGELAVVSSVIPQLDNTKGWIKMNLQLQGTVNQPRIYGRLRLQNITTELPDLGLKFKELNFNVRGYGSDNLVIKGTMKSGRGKLLLTGKINFDSFLKWKIDLNLRASSFEVANIPEAWVLASPNLKISIKPKKLKITGRVLLPRATFTPSKAKNDLITLSEDVIIVNSKNSEPKPIKKIAISTKIKMILGKKVRFRGYGVKANLNGGFIYKKIPGKTSIANGEINIINGSYKAYGQNLTLDEGRIIFANNPVYNPNLDITASRRIIKRGEYNVTAGIKIQGNAQSPQISLFSQPSFDQSNILSYLILGKPLMYASDKEGASLFATAIAMQIDENESLTSKFAQSFGLDDAQIYSEGSINETALVLGKYLNPNLYISYGIGLFTGNQLFKARYSLTDNLMLETETGTESGADIRYTFER